MSKTGTPTSRLTTFLFQAHLDEAGELQPRCQTWWREGPHGAQMWARAPSWLAPGCSLVATAQHVKTYLRCVRTDLIHRTDSIVAAAGKDSHKGRKNTAPQSLPTLGGLGGGRDCVTGRREQAWRGLVCGVGQRRPGQMQVRG